MNSLKVFVLLGICYVIGSACSSTKIKQIDPFAESYWEDISGDLERQFETKKTPEKYRLLKLDLERLKKSVNKQEEITFILPDPGTGFYPIQTVNASPMSPALAEKYPELKSFRGIRLPDGVISVNVDLNPSGFFAMITTTETTYFVNPVAPGSPYYFCYDKRYAKPDMKNPFFETPLNRQ